MRWKNWSYWFKGAILTITIEVGFIILSFLLTLIGFGSNISLMASIGISIAFVLLILASFIGGSFVEIVNFLFSTNIPISSGGGTPTSIVQIIAFVLVIILGTLVGWIIGKIKKKR